MQRTNGLLLCPTSFKSLTKGDVYFITDQKVCRTFERFAKCYAKKGTEKAVNTLGHVNPRGDMRWPTVDELNTYKRSQGLPCTQPSVSSAQVSEKEDTMSKTEGCGVVSNALVVVKADGTDALWRTASKQAMRAVRAPLAALLGKNLPSGVVGLVLSQLDTAHGEALLSFVVGHTMSYVPQFACDKRLMRLAKELRVAGMSHYTDMVADAVLSPLRDQLVEVVKMIPFGTTDE